MYLNRISFSLNNSSLKISKLFSIVEEIIFHYLPSKVNLGGYGFLNILINSKEEVENNIKVGGQIISYHIKDDFFKTEEINRLEVQQQFDYLIDLFDLTINQIALKYQTDIEIFNLAINKCKTNRPILIEDELKILKTHTSRKFSIKFYRILDLNGEKIIYRVYDKNHILLREQLIQNDTSIYDISYDYKTSKWINENLVVFNRFGEEKLKISLQEFIS